MAEVIKELLFNPKINFTITQKEELYQIIDDLFKSQKKNLERLNLIPEIKKLHLIFLMGYNFSEEKVLTYEEDKRKGLVYYNIPNVDNIELNLFRGILHADIRELKFPEWFNSKILVVASFNKWPEALLRNLEEGTGTSSNDEELTTFVPINPKFTFDQIILDDDTHTEIKKTLSMIKIRNKLYDEWGFKKIEPAPRLILNFYGQPGTGKTMTAHAIANKFNKKILALNYAEIESKFVGDAPKNLVRAFETASRENAVLFFDEADSFLGKRITSVSTSSDQAVNSLRSQMIILLDNFSDIIVIFATNLLTNYDRAFESRIFKHIKFNLPNKENRKKMIRLMIPEEVPFDSPLTTEQIELLADLTEDFSGREIKNAILDTLVTVLHEEREYATFSDFENNFNLAKKAKEKLENEFQNSNSKLDPIKKKELEEKIRKNLNDSEFDIERTILELVLHAMLIDKKIHQKENELFSIISRSMNIEVDMPENINKLTPVDDLLQRLNSINDKVQALNFVVHLLAADGEFNDLERNFIEQLCIKMNFPADISKQLILSVEKITDGQNDWLKVQDKILELKKDNNKETNILGQEKADLIMG